MPLPQYEPKTEDPITTEKNQLYQILKDIPYRIGVHAGKGGVGKTLLATQLAQLLANKYTVGLIDADVDCPNVPQALLSTTELRIDDEGKIIPFVYKAIQIVSTGFMQSPEEPLIIRGPIKHRLLTDFIQKTAWKDLDVLIFDFPPGTSDIPLSAMQVASLTGVIIITTPQSASLADARRAIAMAKKLNTHIYGIVENMSGDVFGRGAGQALAEEKNIPFLGSIPMSADTAQHAHEKIVLPLDVQTKLQEML